MRRAEWLRHCYWLVYPSHFYMRLAPVNVQILQRHATNLCINLAKLRESWNIIKMYEPNFLIVEISIHLNTCMGFKSTLYCALFSLPVLLVHSIAFFEKHTNRPNKYQNLCSIEALTQTNRVLNLWRPSLLGILKWAVSIKVKCSNEM